MISKVGQAFDCSGSGNLAKMTFVTYFHFPSRPERPVSSPDLQDSDINGLQRPYNNVAENYRANDPPRRFISGPHKIEKPVSGGSAGGPQTKRDPGLTHNVQAPLTHSGLQGPLIQDLNMVALQQQQQQVLVKPMRPLSRLKSSSTKATTTTKVVPTFWFNTTKAPSTTITTTTTTSTTPTTGKKDQLEAFGVGSDFKYPAAWKNKIPRFPYVPLPKVVYIIRFSFSLKTDLSSDCSRM